MITRLAFFEGTIKKDCTEAFDRYLEENLVPLWTRFPGAVAVRLHREVDRDAGAPMLPLVLSITYESNEAMQQALESDVRMRSREVTKGLFQYFDGRIYHLNARALDWSPVT